MTVGTSRSGTCILTSDMALCAIGQDVRPSQRKCSQIVIVESRGPPRVDGVACLAFLWKGPGLVCRILSIRVIGRVTFRASGRGVHVSRGVTRLTIVQRMTAG